MKVSHHKETSTDTRTRITTREDYVRYMTPDAERISDDIDAVCDGTLDSVRIQLHGCEVVICLDAYQRLHSFINDTSGG